MKTINTREDTEAIIYKDMVFELTMVEKGPLFDPWELGLISDEKRKNDLLVKGSYEIKDFTLYLKGFEIIDTRDRLPVKKEDLQMPLFYNGSMLLAKDFLEDYREYRPIYGYKKFLELIFEDGRLITAVDHSRAMYRIRRNLETGLRDLSNPKDVRCIFHFVNDLFIGKYKEPLRARGFYMVKMGLSKIAKSILKQDRKQDSVN